MFISKHMEQSIVILGSRGKLIATLVQPVQAHTLVIMLHGLMSHRNCGFFRELSKQLSYMQIATMRFDFNGHGQSDGKFQDMTVENELIDAQCVLNYAIECGWIKKIILVGHSLGGVVAGLLAADNPTNVKAIVQVSPAAVMHDDALAGRIMNATYNPNIIPPYVRVFFVKKIGRAYLEAARDIDVFARSCSFAGRVCLIHGRKDRIVPFSYSEQYHRLYPNSELHIVDKENHLLLHDRMKIIHIITDFIKSLNN